MAGVDFTQKSSLRRAHTGQRLAGHGLRIEDDEIHRVAVAQRDADLGFALEAADAAAVAGARIDDHPRPAILARRHRAFGRAADIVAERYKVSREAVRHVDRGFVT